MPKRPDNLNLISSCSLTSLQLLMFPISIFPFPKESVIIENIKLFPEKFGHFHDAQKIEIDFYCNTFVSYICWQGDFFPRISRDGIKNIFNNTGKDFRMAKVKYSNNDFITGLCYIQINNTYIT